MRKIAIISSSVRIGRKSSRVAAFFKNYIIEKNIADVVLIDLKDYNFPIFEERLKFLKQPPANLLQYAEIIKNADAVLIVSPEYNGGYPPSLKNAIDVLVEEWKHKPVAISTVSGGPFGGNNMIPSLQYCFWKLGALTAPALFPVSYVDKSYDENGIPADTEATNKRADKFLGELVWLMDAVSKMQ